MRIFIGLCFFLFFLPQAGGCNGVLYVSWVSPEQTPNKVDKYEKLEIGVASPFAISNQIQQFFETQKHGLNPFNPDQINLEAIFTAPSGKSKRIYGFYYQPYSRDLKNDVWIPHTTNLDWRIRFAPDEEGEWNMSVKMTSADGEINILEKSLVFSCTPTKNKGYLTAEKGTRFLTYSETKEPFFATGHNVTHASYDEYSPRDAQRHYTWLRQLADNGANFFRLEMGGQTFLPDWNSPTNYNTKLAEMWELDRLMDSIHHWGLYFIMFRHHVELETAHSDWPIVQWDKNPYKTTFGITRQEYFTDSEMLRLQKNTLRYIFSRWGYSVNFAFYGYSEIDNFYKDYMKENNLNEKEALTTITSWLKEHKEFYTQPSENGGLGYDRILFLNTYAALPGAEKSNPGRFVFNLNDVNGIHKYGETKGINYDWNFKEAQLVWEKWKKPFIFEELGYNANYPDGNSDFIALYCCTDIDFNRYTWATSLMGTFGTGMHWWWDRGLHLGEYYRLYNGINYFFNQVDFRAGEFSTIRWRDKRRTKKASLEAYYQRNDGGSYAFGWVSNVTFYWRNLMETDDCLKHIKETGKLVSPCVCEDGIRLGEDTIKADILNPRFEDIFTHTGGPRIFKEGETRMKLKGLKRNKTYEITFYFATREISGVSVQQQTFRASRLGKTSVSLPVLDRQNPGYAFIVKETPILRNQ